MPYGKYGKPNAMERVQPRMEICPNCPHKWGMHTSMGCKVAYCPCHNKNHTKRFLESVLKK